ncbi:putative cyclin-dependent kinase F-2 [Triticum aestivum]|nr:putative cyclin-dependent kinase F-2 [Triticum aestivum]
MGLMPSNIRTSLCARTYRRTAPDGTAYTCPARPSPPIPRILEPRPYLPSHVVSLTGAGAGCTMTSDEHAGKACPARGIRSFRTCRILWIFVEISLGILVIFKNLWIRLRLAEAQLAPTLPSASAAGTTTMTAARVADIFAMIDDHTAAGTMSGKQVEAICAMINDACNDDAKGLHSEKGRRRRERDAGIGSTRCYKQMRRLGKGSSGRVVMAQHRNTGQTVALKTIHARGGARRPNVGDLLKEACVLAACRGHPNLVGLHAIVRDPGTKQYCLVMDYVGPSLFHALDRHVEEHGRAFPEADVRRVMRQLLTGAAAMHERGIIHRDMKTANILIGEDGGVVKFCDYGLAMPTAKAEPPYGLAGTVPYMAPEMLLEKPEYDAAVDMWSLGCVMAEMLSGEELFSGEKTTGQVGKILDVLGAPGRKTWQHLESALRADEVRQWRARQREVRRRHDRLRELFPEELLSWHGFHVLKGLLTCNPSKRLTAAAALRCPWFKVDGPGTDDASGHGIGGTALARHTS